MQRVPELEHEGRRVVQVAFQMPWAVTSTMTARVKRGTAYFDADSLWVMRKCDYQREQFRGKRAPTITSHALCFDYDICGDGFPLLTRMTKHNLDGKNVATSVETYECQFQFTEASEADFALRTFGIPDPDPNYGIRGTSWHLWLIVGGAAAIALSYLARRRIQRRRISASET